MSGTIGRVCNKTNDVCVSACVKAAGMSRGWIDADSCSGLCERNIGAKCDKLDKKAMNACETAVSYGEQALCTSSCAAFQSSLGAAADPAMKLFHKAAGTDDTVTCADYCSDILDNKVSPEAVCQAIVGPKA